MPLACGLEWAQRTLGFRLADEAKRGRRRGQGQGLPPGAWGWCGGCGAMERARGGRLSPWTARARDRLGGRGVHEEVGMQIV